MIDLSHITLRFADRVTSVKEVAMFEEPDTTVGIFGCYIEVIDSEGCHWVLNDNGNRWVHPFKVGVAADNPDVEVNIDEDVDWNTIAGTFDGELWPNRWNTVITVRDIVDGFYHTFLLDPENERDLSEFLDERYGISLDTKLEVE